MPGRALGKAPSAADAEAGRERLRRAVEDGERLYRVRMHGENGETVSDGNRINGILTLDLVAALALVDSLGAERIAKAAERIAQARRDLWWFIEQNDIDADEATARAMAIQDDLLYPALADLRAAEGGAPRG